MSKKLSKIILVVTVLLGFLQIKTTEFESLVNLSNDEQRVKEERIKFYNPSNHFVRLFFHKFNLVNFYEGDFNTISIRLQRNFFETIDPNVYFFAGHPRERVWAKDFEKFPGILIILFLAGLYITVKRKEKFIVLSLVLAFLLLSYIGHKNPYGAFMLYPVIAYLIAIGGLFLWKQRK